MKKMVILSWELLEAGGINSIIMGYQSGFQKLGWDVVTYHASKNGRLMLSEDEFTLNTKWFRAKGLNLGWDNNEQLRAYAKDVKESDFVFSIHGAPHPTKSSAKGDFGWHRLYEIPKRYNTPVGIIFTDNLWNKLYAWIADIIDDDIKLFYNNKNAGFDSIAKLPFEAMFVDYPMDFDSIPKHKPHNKRTIDVCWMPQWKKWKGIYELIDQLAQNPDAIKMIFFNSGIEYYNLRLTENWKKAIRHENRPKVGAEKKAGEGKYFNQITHNEKSTVDYFGLVYPDQVNQIYSNSKVSVDLSGAYSKRMTAQYSCVMLESIANKCVVAAPPDIINGEKSRIGGLDIAHQLELNALVDSLEDLLRDEKRRLYLSNRAYEWARLNCGDDTVSKIIAQEMGA